MPKITAGGGPSNQFEPQPPQERPGEGVFFAPVPGSPEALAEAAVEPEPVDAASIEIEPDGGEQPSPGNSSSTSSPPSGRTTRRRPNKVQSPAPSTEPPSSPPPTEAADSAPTGTTSGPGTDGEASPTPAATE